ncbi:P-loop containing nucleoside triphosphate hydrolase protein [Lasiosphaeria miniovina]|uniref:P-loop containing nucleoside triphosphate hydrolase protein n=1 Tax=Lasiosphaeria miniovina TaxID=1954250 RepID=A0AA40ALW2_9PEZI|nr:P-loop containing nucleoside triphosphate hydrolase protein [Lasiosphaeria miniovina]KAK0718247.1 P-loop containing nucleoside triphosphate hydrolase protein [Lasiosphaeria miniovina]
MGFSSSRCLRAAASCRSRLRYWATSSSALVLTRATHGAPATSLGIRLRNYQEECIQSILTSFDQGHKRVGVSLATGSGKTVIFTHLIDRVKPLSPTATQTLILAHRKELVEQAARHCANVYPDKTIEVEMAKLSASGTADITVASIQSMTSKGRLAKFDPSRFKLVLVDEAHHIVAPGYLRVLGHLGLATKQPSSPHLVGVSATFSRFDGLALGAAIDEIVYHKDYVDMIGEKWLCDAVFTTVDSKANLSKVSRLGKGGGGDFDTAALSRAVNTDEINDITVRAWVAKASGRKSTLVFCVDLAHVASLTQSFRHYGVDARFVTGGTRTRERSACLDAFKAGEFPVLLNCGVFTEGTDIPNIDCVLLARPTRSRNLLVQMIGRGMRLHPGKENCHVIDMVSSLEAGVVTTPTLFGLDPAELLDAASVNTMQNIRDRTMSDETVKKLAQQPVDVSQTAGRAYKVTFTEYDSVFDLVADSSGEKHIRAISKFAWVQVAQNRYVLDSASGTFLRLEKVEDDETSGAPRFKAWEVRSLPPGLSKSPYAAPRQLLVAESFIDAVHGCDKYAGEKFYFGTIYLGTRWRQGPATEGQLKFLNKLRRFPDQPYGPGDLTGGKAADMIAKFKHGARGRFANLLADQKRRHKASLVVDQEHERKLREIVSVGPLLS